MEVSPPNIKVRRAAVKLAYRRHPELDRNEPVPPDILDSAIDTIRQRNNAPYVTTLFYDTRQPPLFYPYCALYLNYFGHLNEQTPYIEFKQPLFVEYLMLIRIVLFVHPFVSF